jgi:Holliday junction resolvase-like predicted endonuclease
MNRTRKGTRTERVAADLLERQGYVVHRCVKTVVRKGPRWMTVGSDIFGNIDLIAKKKGERTRWIQVTSSSSIGRKRADLLVTPWEPAHDSVEIWRWISPRRSGEPGRFQLYRLDDGLSLDRADCAFPTA